MKPIVQVSIDVTTLEEAMELARGAVRAGVDWLEAGTPLILAEGLHCVKAFREQYPDVPIVATEVKPMAGEDPEEVLASSKQTWRQAWSML